MSSTTPYWSSTNTQSPTRSGCVTASMIPATKFASVWRAAKPSTAAAIAPDASSEPASRLMLAKFDSATATRERAVEQDRDEQRDRDRDAGAHPLLGRAARRDRAAKIRRGHGRRG